MITRIISRTVSGVLTLGLALLLSACYETKQEFTLNPDGSGKVRHECSFQNVNLSNQNDTSEEALQAAIGKIIKDSKGVEAWRDVSFKRLADGRLWFQGTAYFKNLAELEIPNQSMLGFDWKSTGAGTAELVGGLKKSGTSKPPAKSADLTPEERARLNKEARTKFQQSKPMLAAMLEGMKQSVTFRVPGKLGACTNFKTKPGGTLGIEFSGQKMLAALDTLVKDDAWLAKNGFDTKEPPEMDNALGGLLFGEKAPVKAAISGATTPLFDYAAEVAAATKDASKLAKQLGIVSIAPPAKGQTLKSLKVVGVQFASEVDKKLELRPFNEDAGYQLSVLAELPGSVLDISDKSAILSATANDGTDLLKGDSDWDRRLGFPKLSADKASVIFDLKLKLPPPAATGIKEITGNLQYQVSGGTKTIDLGLKSLKPGTKGSELAASIESIKEGWQKNGSQDMELKLKLAAGAMKSATLVANGVKTELTRSGYGSSGGTTTFTLTSKTAFPESGSIVVEIHDQIQTFDTPFKLQNLTLLGKPAAPQ